LVLHPRGHHRKEGAKARLKFRFHHASYRGEGSSDGLFGLVENTEKKYTRGIQIQHRRETKKKLEKGKGKPGKLRWTWSGRRVVDSIILGRTESCRIRRTKMVRKQKK